MIRIENAVILTKEDGLLWRAMRRAAAAPDQGLDFPGLARAVTQREGLKVQTNIAQVHEILRVIRDIYALDPRGVIAVLEGGQAE